jgi:hypothetical protein
LKINETVPNTLDVPRLVCGVILSVVKRVRKANGVETLHSRSKALKENCGFTWVFGGCRHLMTQLARKVLPIAIDRTQNFEGLREKEVKAGYIGILPLFTLRCGLGSRCGADG